MRLAVLGTMETPAPIIRARIITRPRVRAEVKALCPEAVTALDIDLGELDADVVTVVDGDMRRLLWEATTVEHDLFADAPTLVDHAPPPLHRRRALSTTPPSEATGSPRVFRVCLGRRDTPKLYTGFDTHTATGVFVPTHRLLPIEAHVLLVVDTPAGTFAFGARVHWRRELSTEPGAGWPGLGLRVPPEAALLLTHVVSILNDEPPLFYPD